MNLLTAASLAAHSPPILPLLVPCRGAVASPVVGQCGLLRHIYPTRRRACRRAHSDPARRSTPWKNWLSTWLRRPAQLRELRGRHAPSPFYPAARGSRRSQARLSERALRHVSAESAFPARQLVRGSGRHAAAANLASGASRATDGKTLRSGECRQGHGPGRVAGAHPHTRLSHPAFPFELRYQPRRACCQPESGCCAGPRDSSSWRRDNRCTSGLPQLSSLR
jgi:hypothetical protein